MARERLLPLARRFVWLLRDDVRKGKAAGAAPDEFFERWWLLKGRAEYPAWASLSPSEIAVLAERSVMISVDGVALAMPKAFEWLLGFRPDVVRRFTINRALDTVGAAGWFFTLGLPHHLLQACVGSDLLRDLDKPAANQEVDQSAPSATLLMRLVWQLLDTSLHGAMALQQPESRARFMSWFFGVAVHKFGLAPLLASRWRHWLLQEMPLPGQAAVSLPRFAWHSYLVSPELQQRVAQADPEDVRAGAHPLVAWSERSVRSAGRWHWLKGGTLAAVPLPLAPQVPSARPFGVNLFGFAYGELGIGEDLRMAVDACTAAGIPYRVVNIDAGKNLRQADQHLRQQVEQGVSDTPFAINVFCLPGFDTVSRVFLGMGPEVFEGHYNIGWWPWELPVWPKAWSGAFELVDEIWSGSTFAREMYARSTSRPVILMPLPVCVARHQPLPRRHFGLPERKFLFLFIFDFNSHLARKNPGAAVAAFREAFPASDRQVGLVMKAMNGRAGDAGWEAFRKQVAGDQRIVLITETLDRHAVLGLVDACDAYVSLHRAEGFGRTLAEAMLLGKPVVATDYSGNHDFMDRQLTFPVRYEEVAIQPGEYPFIETEDGATWAHPSMSDAARQMRAARAHAGKRPFANALRQFARTQFSVSRIGALMAERLVQIRGEMAEKQG